MRANLYFVKSLSETPIRACSRFFVSANFSPFESSSKIKSRVKRKPTHRSDDKSEGHAVCSRNFPVEVEDTNDLGRFVRLKFISRNFLFDKI
jgi:hypothetical protein